METLSRKLWSLLLLFLALSFGRLRGDDDHQGPLNGTIAQFHSQAHNNNSNNATFLALDQVNVDPIDGRKVNYTSVVVGSKNTNNNGYFRGGNRGGGGGGGGGGGNNGGGGGSGFSWGWGGGGGGGSGGGGSGGNGNGNGWGWGVGGGGGGWWKWGYGGQPRRGGGGGGGGRGIVRKSSNNKFHRFDPKDYVMGEYAQCMVKGRCKGLRLDCPLHCGGPCLYDCRYMCKAHCRHP